MRFQKNTQEIKNERYLIRTRQNKVKISANFAFNTAMYERTNRCKTTEMRMTRKRKQKQTLFNLWLTMSYDP